MRNWTVPLLAVLVAMSTGSAYATVYKTVDAAGNTVYSDSPSKNAKVVDLPPLSIVPSLNPAELNQPAQAANAARPTQYRLNFVSPLNDQAIRKPEPLEVSVEVSPALADGDSMVILLDGKLIGAGAGASVDTENVDRGTHQLTARVSSARGQVISEKSISVNIQQSSVNSPANQAKQPKPGKK